MKHVHSSKLAFLNLILLVAIVVLPTSGRLLAEDRIFGRGDNWIRNGTGNQLDGYMTIRLSDNMYREQMKYVTNTLNKNLMIAIGNLAPPDYTWPSSATADSYVNRFADSLSAWSADEINISAIFYNHEVPYQGLINAHSDSSGYNSLQVCSKYADLFHKYRQKLSQYYPNAKLWIFSAHHDTRPGFEFSERETDCIDWNLVTSGPYAPDYCMSGISLITMDPYSIEAEKGRWSKLIRDTSTQTNGKFVSFDIATYGYSPDDPDGTNPISFTYVRNRYQNNWENFKELVRHTKAVADSVNGIDTPIMYYQLHYRDWRNSDNYTYLDPQTYTSFTHIPPSTNFPGTFREVPYPDGYDYPPQFWINGAANWQWSQTLNQWDAEISANFLKALNYNLPGRQLTNSMTWSGNIMLLGDVEVPSSVTLTIEPGTHIYFRPDTDVYESGWKNQKAEIVIKQGGALVADATGGNPIRFQSSLNIDQYGLPSKDDWGGIRNEGGTLTLKNCQIRDAEVGVEVTSYQGITTLSLVDLHSSKIGMKIREGASETNPELTNVGLYYNDEGILAGMYGTGKIKLVNATIADNFQGVSFVDDGANPELVLKNTAVTFNGYGAYVQNTPTNTGILTLQYCDVYGSTSEVDFHGKYTSMPTGSNNMGNFSGDPLFVTHNTNNEFDEDYHIQEGSPLIDSGDPSMTDPDNSTINIGRYGNTSEYTVGPAPGGVLLDETFTYSYGTEPAPGWIDEGNENDVHWKVKNEEYVLESSNINVNRAYRKINAASYVIQTRIKFDADEGKVIYSHSDQHELYRIDLMDNNNVVRLMINDQPSTAPYTINRNQWYTVKIEAQSGSHVKVWIDGNDTHNIATGLTFDGWIGAGAYNATSNGVTFDDFKVTTIGGGSGGGSWTNQDIGNVQATGSYTENSGNFIVNGSGNDIWDGQDEFHFVHQPLSGNGWISAQVYSQQSTNEWAKAGVMIRDNTNDNCAHAMMTLTPSHGTILQGRQNAGSNSIHPATDNNTPQWVKIERSGDTFKGFVSTDGSNWNQIGSMTAAMSNDVLMGLCVTSHNDGTLSQVEFRTVNTGVGSGKPVISLVDELITELPDTFAVSQNYPNPFNPETVIAYSVAHQSDVNLIVYNVLGQKVRTLVSELKPAGKYRIVWDGKDDLGQPVSSGIYLYQISAGQFNDTRKMLILK